jgi:diketogulonate reductase-like aldo/keto reductase
MWTVTPAVNQIQYHVGMGKDPEGLRAFCKERGIVVQVTTSTITNFVSLCCLKRKQFAYDLIFHWVQAYSPLDADQKNGSAVLINGNLTNRIGAAHDKSGAQVALKFIVQQVLDFDWFRSLFSTP